MFHSNFLLCCILLTFCLVINVASFDDSREPLYPGKYCDPVFYNKMIKPFKDSLFKIFQEDQGTRVREATADIIKDFSTALDETIEVPPSERDPQAYRTIQSQNQLGSKGCWGLLALYLDCDEEQSKCVCQSAFPFNSTVVQGGRGRCHAQPGSICSINHDFLLPCAGVDLTCTRDGLGDTRYCGGSPMFQQAYTEQGISEGGAGSIQFSILIGIASALLLALEK